MKIIFANNNEFNYTQAYALERDFKNGYTRPSIEICMPAAQLDFNEINSIISDAEIMKTFTLVGDAPVDGEGNVIGLAPIALYEDYTIKGKISLEDDEIIFKMYRLSDMEIENREAKAAIDELLITMGEIINE